MPDDRTPTLAKDDLADRIANISEGYYCEDCDRWVSKSNYGYHNADHSMLKESVIGGWEIAKALAERERRIEEAHKNLYALWSSAKGRLNARESNQLENALALLTEHPERIPT